MGLNIRSTKSFYFYFVGGQIAVSWALFVTNLIVILANIIGAQAPCIRPFTLISYQLSGPLFLIKCHYLWGQEGPPWGLIKPLEPGPWAQYNGGPAPW